MSRYIDADKLPRHGNRGGLVHWKDIENAPTADVRENVHGMYIKNADCEYTCSICGIVFDDFLFDKKPPFNYCPNCGADMRTD